MTRVVGAGGERWSDVEYLVIFTGVDGLNVEWENEPGF